MVLDSIPDDEWDEDTGRIDVVLNNSQVPSRVRGVVGFLAAFPQHQRIWAWIVLVILVLGLVALGAAKILGMI